MERLNELRALALAPTVNWSANLDRHCQGVAEAMTAIHGGNWNVSVDHEHCQVLIAREFEE